MKKLFFAVIAALGLLLHSCNKESYYHSQALLYPTGYQVAVVFADQTYDSLYFYTTDRTQISVYDAPWMSIPDSMKTLNIQNQYRVLCFVNCPVTFEPNTTGKPRMGHIRVHTTGADDWDNTTTASYYQLSWLDISRPAPAYSYNDNLITGAAFKTKVGAEQTADTLEFWTAGRWTLSDGLYVHPEVSSGGEGMHKIPVRIDVNATEAERIDTVTLTSNGVSSHVQFTQEIKKEETEE